MIDPGRADDDIKMMLVPYNTMAVIRHSFYGSPDTTGKLTRIYPPVDGESLRHYVGTYMEQAYGDRGSNN